jgi:secondary thiamine-phosphate synthase enzyme
MKRSASDRSCSKRVSERAGPGTALRITAVRRLTVRTDRRTQLVDITRLVEEALDGADGAGAALVYVPHTTAGVTINESADPAVARDIEAALERLVDDGWPWQHVDDPDGPNAPSHVRASLLGPQVLVPVEGGKLALGRWQGIFFCELDGPRERTVLVTPLS